MVKSFLVLIFIIFFSVNLAFATNSYDATGRKTGSIKETSLGYNKYDRNGNKTASYIKALKPLNNSKTRQEYICKK